MDVVNCILQNIDVLKLLEHYNFENIHHDGNMIRSCCKLHEGNNPNAFVINEENGLYYCHTNCGGGDAFTLVEKMEDISFLEAVQWLANFFDVNIEGMEIKERSCDYLAELRNFIRVMREKKNKTFTEFKIPEEVKQVTRYRNFKEETLKHFHLGYVESVQLKKRDGKEYKLFHRLVFPIYFNNMQVGLSFRKTKSADFPKWSHQPANLETKNILYNYDDAKDSNIIVVCEGFLDVWAFHEIGIPAVATFGAHLTNQQYKLLLQTGADLVFAYDGDDAGRKATQEAVRMFKHKANIATVEFEEGQDPENIPREELRERYDRKQRK